MEKRWVVYREAEFSTGTKRWYLAQPGSRITRGMYRNQRTVGYHKATWTTDPALARRFDSPSAARRNRAALYPLTWDSKGIQTKRLPEARSPQPGDDADIDATPRVW